MALGDPVAPADWTQLPAAAWTEPGAASAPPAAWLDLVDAVREPRLGEAVLATVLVAAPAGNLSGEPIALGAAVTSLRHIGLVADARRLAVEAALAAAP
jgi:hypothetical protein